MSIDRTIASLRNAAAAARLGHKAARRTRLLALQAALRHYAATFEEPADFAARALLEIDSALSLIGPDPHTSGRTRDTSRLLQRVLADLGPIVGE
jgi:hypothetical protein